MRRRAFLEVDPAEAASFVAFTLGWPGGKLPVYTGGERGFSLSLHAGAALIGPRLWGRVRDLDVSVDVGLAFTGPFAVSAPCLWAWVSSPDSLLRAARFRPSPSLVLRAGGSSERLLLWGLREVVGYERLVALNERLSYFLRAPRTRCDPTSLRVPLPGTFRRDGGRPRPVVVTRMDLGDFAAGEVAGRLREPPSKDAWRERAHA